MSEIEEVRKLLTIATFPGVVNVLKSHEKLLLAQQEEQQKKNEMEQQTNDNNDASNQQSDQLPPAPPVALKQNVTVAAPLPSTGGRVVYTPITDFAWDQNGYDSPTVTVYVDIEDVGTVKDQVTCNFTKSSFDLEVLNLKGKNYRLIKDNLDKDIIPEKSKTIIKKHKVVIKLCKVKGQYSYESWTNLTSKKTAEKRNQANKDPSSGIMDMMKDMYDEGDDNMKKIIGEAMMKSKSGEKMEAPSL